MAVQSEKRSKPADGGSSPTQRDDAAAPLQPDDRASSPSQLDEHEIRTRAYEISERPDAGSAEENWQRAIRELLDGRGQSER